MFKKEMLRRYVGEPFGKRVRVLVILMLPVMIPLHFPRARETEELPTLRERGFFSFIWYP